MPYIGNQPYQGVIDSGNIVDGSIQTGDLANSAVTTAKIADSNITSAKIADTGVTVAKLNSDVTQLIAQGGGPKITGVAITDSSWTTIDDTAVDTAGGYVKLTGTNFVTGCSVVVGTTSATAVTFTSSTELRVQLPAQAAGTYILYVTNPDGGTAIRVNAVTYSATPSWVTSSTLPQQDDGVAISIQLSATSATTYALQAGSTLPSGLTLTSGGLLSGTVSGLANDTSYSFTVVASDAELQDSPRAFTVTISAVDPYFNLTTLLINSDTAPNVLTDASSNNFNLIAYGDARASNFTPYGTGWSNYFNGSSDYLSFADNAAFDLANNNFTIECWVYITSFNSQYNCLLSQWDNSLGYYFYLTSSAIRFGYQISGSNLVTEASGLTNSTNTWIHLAVVRNSNSLTIYKNGTSVGSGSITGTINNSSNQLWISGLGNGSGAINNTTTHFGYISNIRLVNGTALYTENFTPATTNLTSVANTSLLTCHTNRFADGSANNFAITRNGNVAVRSFNPFNITNTGTSGSIYFDGTDDYVTVGTTASNAFAFSGDFTIEAWFYKPGNGSDTYEMLLSIGDGNGVNGFFLELDDTRSLAPRLYMNNGALVLDGYVTSKINDAQWHHIACVRSGSNCAMFYDGTRVATSTSSASLVSSASALYIGRASNASVNDFYGYVSDLRIINGTAAYNPTLTTITVPTQPLTAVANTQLLTHQYKQPHNNHGFQDSSTNNHLITRNGNTTQGTFSPFSPVGWSGYFNGSTDGIVIASGSDSYDFNSWMLESTASKTGTIEAWIYLQSYSTPTSGTGAYTHRCIFGRGSTFLNFGVRPDGKLRLYYYNTSSNQNWFESAANAIQLNTWYHVAFVADAGIAKLYINGVYSSGNRINAGTDSGTTAFNGVAVGTFSEGGIHYIGRENAETTTSRWHGYIANFRIVNGQSLYTTNFTPSTSPLTTTSQGVTGTNCKLLTLHTNRFKDDGPNNRTFTLEGTTSIQAYSPFKPTAAYSPITHGGSAYLDGTGDYCLVSDSPLFSLAAADFTIESWIYKTASGRAEWFGQCDSAGTAASGSFDLQVTAGGKLSCGVFSGATSYFATSTADFPLNSWTHVVLCRDGTTIRQYINGVQDGTSSIGTASVNDSSTNLGIGRLGDFTSNYLTGYMSSTRIIRGQCLYPSGTTFTPPTAPPSATTNTSLLVNFTDAAARDSTGRLVLETVGDSKVSSVQKKYGTGSIYFDGSGDYILTPSSGNFAMWTGDFTVEGWMYNTDTVNQPIISIGTYLTGLDCRLSETSSNQFGCYVNNTWYYGAFSNSNQWSHFAISRASGTLRIFINGSAILTQAGVTHNMTADYVKIGGLTAGGATRTNYLGYLDDLRITKYARYTTTNFTPPAQTFKLR